MLSRLSFVSLLISLVLSFSAELRADTFVIPFSDIRQDIEGSPDDPDAVIRAYLAALIREELDAQGFNVDGGLVFGEIPIDEMTDRIADHCYVPTPYKVHTDATTATVTINDSSSITLGLDSIRSIDLFADLNGVIETYADAWVRWGQDVPFVGSCKTISTDHGWVSLAMTFVIDLDLNLQLDPVYDPDQVAIVVDKHAILSGSGQFLAGILDHDFGSVSLTDVVIDAFEDDLIDSLSQNGEQAVADAIVELNYRLDGRDENGIPDPTIEPFNAPSTFVLSADESDQAFIRDLLAQLGVPELVLAMVEDRGVEILLQLIVLEGAERDAYLASLGAEVGCAALLGSYQLDLPAEPLYSITAQGCEAVGPASTASGPYFSDAGCSDELAFNATDPLEYCQAYFGPDAGTLLGNAASWEPDTAQPGDELPGTPSTPWTLVPTTELDLGTVSLAGNHQPYMKQLQYKTITGTSRGSGTCELEMRVYKREITGQGLKPLIALHGGTWQNRGSSYMGLEAGISQLTDRGFVVFAPFYRLVSDRDGNIECNGASWHEVTADVEDALDWVLENGSAFGAVDGQVSLFGQSAGAHLATWLAANRNPDIRKAALFYGPGDALEFLAGAVPFGGPYEAYRDFGLRSLGRFFGASLDVSDLHLEAIDYAGLTPALLASDWDLLIPDAVFDLSGVDQLAPPVYVARCAAATMTDLGTINLASPPADLMDCMKQDLSDFLVANSFNHQLAGNSPPLYIVHGSADSVVPVEQAVNLCAAIDGSVYPTDVVDPLTVYNCGIASEASIVRNADHALDLGFCVPPLCPAGPPGSETRVAAADSILASYAWLQEDDTDRDGVPDDEDAFPDDPAESVDTDGDGVGNNADPDDDNDGVSDDDELLAGTNPLNADTDGDDVVDGIDNCGSTSNPDQFDADRDGLGNACDDANSVAGRDFDGDGVSDIPWRNTATGQNRLWLMHDATVREIHAMPAVTNLGWHIAAIGDFNADGRDDFVWRNGNSGALAIWLMQGASRIGNVGLPTVSGNDWQIVGSRDFDSDGDADLLWRNSATGQNALWVFEAGQLVANRAVPAVTNLDWTVIGTGDFDADGYGDILWRHARNGKLAVWFMQGALRRDNAAAGRIGDPDWVMPGTGDFDGDGKTDLLWRNTATGQVAAWLMDGATRTANVGLSTVSSPDWQVLGTGDYDGDGRADILWRNPATGQDVIHVLDGAGIARNSALIAEPDTDWVIVNPAGD